MAITKDRKEKRKPSWESKISVCTASTRPVGRSERSDTPSSILSSDSDIRFTRKLGSHYRCGCYILTGFLVFLLVVAISIYVAYTFILSQTLTEKVFRVNFRVANDIYEKDLSDPETEKFRIRARNYKERLNLLFRRSELRKAFLKTNILALDGNEGEDLTVHFNVHFDTRRREVNVTDVQNILQNEIYPDKVSRYLYNMTIPVESLEIFDIMDVANITEFRATKTPPVETTPTVITRECVHKRLQYCSKMSHNFTSYPNIMGHKNYYEMLDDLIAFREIVDSECYAFAYDFVCLLLEPPCETVDPDSILDDIMLMPCRSYCNDFMKNCGSRLPSHLKNALDCSKYPELSSGENCIVNRACLNEISSKELNSRLCDGVIDCPDASDEVSCSYCKPGHLHCGAGKVCIPPHKRCDGNVDCPTGSDEINCFSIIPYEVTDKPITLQSVHLLRYYNKGYVVSHKAGKLGKICTNESSYIKNSNISAVREMCHNSSLGESLGYQLKDIKLNDSEGPYYTAEHTDFEFSETCDSEQLLRATCSRVQCGIQAKKQQGLDGLGKMGNLGDWPWHVALFKNYVHLCDATLLSEEWILTTESCFQGQNKAEWRARFGIVRLNSTNPWEQERQLVGMLKSQVEGSNLVLLRLDDPVVFSDFVKPICLPDPFEPFNYTTCTTLGWNTEKGQIQRTDVTISNMSLCANMSIANPSAVCAEPSLGKMDCQEEEFAGSTLTCLNKRGTWDILGVINWRIACQENGMERPRLYDSIKNNAEWIEYTIGSASSFEKK